MTKIICLTGGIGSGKSTVAAMFAAHGVPVYIADDAARAVTNTLEITSRIRAIFGDEIYDHDTLDRKALAAVVFNNPEKLRQLNAIIHPAVKADFLQWLENHSDALFVIRESAILFESGTDADCNSIITVTAPAELRIQRIIQRDKTDRKNILERIENQWTDEKKIAKSNFVINNDEIEETKKQVKEILKKMHNI